MATVERDQRIVRVSVTKAEMRDLLGTRARQAGLIDFDPDNIIVQETDAATGAYEITFERENLTGV